MRKSAMRIMLIVSFGALLLLLPGYILRFRIGYLWPAAAGSAREVMVRMEEGRIVLWFESGAKLAGQPAGWTARATWPARVDYRRAGWEFDNHPIQLAGAFVWIIAFPIWCAALPFLILPGMTAYRKLRPPDKDRRGFLIVNERNPSPIN